MRKLTIAAVAAILLAAVDLPDTPAFLDSF